MAYDRILIPVDGSQEATDVVDHAVGLANSTGSSVHVLYVVDERQFTDPEPLLRPDVNDVGTEELLARFEEEGEAATARTKSALADRGVGADVVTAVEQGVPHRRICAYAGEKGIDVIVMATHQRTDRERELLGSVTERVIRTSDVPVFVVPPVPDET